MILLASGSPRRRDLLSWAGFEVRVRPQDVDESWDPRHAPVLHAELLAERKAESARRRLTGGEQALILAADTVVHLGHRIFDKPADRAQARAHLRALSGQTHQVTTGVCLADASRVLTRFSETTTVRFRSLSESEITTYLETGEADDKAGAYGIQGRGGAFVAEVHGSWTNVMGLPLEACLRALEQARPEGHDD